MKAGWRGTEALKWMGFVAAIWLQVINGTNFDFSAYSSVLKDVLELDQVQLNNLALASDLGKALGWISGLASLYLPMWTVLLIAGCLGLVGYGVQWLSLVSKIPPMAYWQAFLLCMLSGNSICWFNTVSYVVCIRNFNANKRGFALGLSTSYVGLSAAVYASIQTAVAPRTKSLFLLLNAGVPATACLLAVPFVGGAPEDQKETAQTHWPFLAAMSYGIAIVTGVYMLVLDFVPSSSGLLHALILLGLLLAPVSLPTTLFITGLRNRAVRKRRQAHRDARVLAIDVLDERDVQEPGIEMNAMGKRGSESKDETEIELSLQIQDQETINSSLIQTNSSEKESKYRRAVLGEDHNTIQLLRSIDFWLFFLVYLCGGTLGLVFINNLGQIAESRGYSKASIFVSLSCSSGFFGRLASSAPDFLLRFKIRLPRPAWIGLSMVPMAASFFLLLINDDVALYVGTAILGFFTGMITSIAISTTSELFGLKNFGVNHNILVVNIPLGSLAFGYLAGIFYDETAKKNILRANQLSAPPVHGTGSTVCHGSHCYNNTFLIWGSVCLIGILLSLILSFRTRTFYQRLHCQNHHLPHSSTPICTMDIRPDIAKQTTDRILPNKYIYYDFNLTL